MKEENGGAAELQVAQKEKHETRHYKTMDKHAALETKPRMKKWLGGDKDCEGRVTFLREHGSFRLADSGGSEAERPPN